MVPSQAEDRSLPLELELQAQGRSDGMSGDSSRYSTDACGRQVHDGYPLPDSRSALSESWNRSVAVRADPRVAPSRSVESRPVESRAVEPNHGGDGYLGGDGYHGVGGGHGSDAYRPSNLPNSHHQVEVEGPEHFRVAGDPHEDSVSPPARPSTGEIEIARELDARYGAADLTPDAFPRPRHAMPPRSGWRRSIYRLTGGAVHPSESAAERRYNAQLERIRQPIRSDYRIALLSLKGGVGKTTTTIGLGSIFASVRGDNVIAVDANPDFGTLGGRVPQQTQSTVRDLLAAGPSIRRYSDVRVHSSQASSRLEVIAGERDPAASEAFTEADYRGVIDILRVHYNLILTDCGTGVMHSAMNGVLSLAHSLILVTTPAVDGASSAAATLEWLQLHGYAHLAERTVMVVSAQRPGSLGINMEALQRHFLARCRAMVVVPFDEHLAEGGIVEIDRLRPKTRAAFVDLAAMVADDFPQNAGRHSARVRGNDQRHW